MELNILDEFRKALKERITDSDLSYMYSLFLSEPFISDEDLKAILLQYQKIYQEHPEQWFVIFHKMLRQTDFFQGTYYKEINTLTEDEMKRRHEIIYSDRNKRTDIEQEELKGLNAKMHKQESVSIGGCMDGLLHSLIYLDRKDELMQAMEITFKICS